MRRTPAERQSTRNPRGRDSSRKGGPRPRSVLVVLAAVGMTLLAGCADPPVYDRWPIARGVSDTGVRFVAYAMPPDGYGMGITGHVVGVRDYVTAICPLEGHGVMVFTPTGGFSHGSYGDEVWSKQAAVRDAVPLGKERLAMLVGGSTAGDGPWLRGAKVLLGRIEGNELLVGEAELDADVNPYRLRSGRFAGEDHNLLVFIYTRAPFDDVLRRRPWIYRVVEANGGLPHLEPRWRGTSFSHPFRDATFCDLTGSGEGEIVALEVARDGGRMLAAYRFEGFGLEGMAPSVDLPQVEDRLQASDIDGDGRDELIVRELDPPGFAAWTLTDEPRPRMTRVARAPAADGVIGWLPDPPHGVLYLLPDSPWEHTARFEAVE